MSGHSDDLEKLIEAVADGQSVDWDELERAAPDEDSRKMVRQLRLIAEVGEVYRSHVDEDADVTVSAHSIASVSTPDYEGGRAVLPVAGGGGIPGGTSSGGIPGSEGVWGHLLLVRKIGEGSFGEVFQAHDTWLDHSVALKLLKREAEARVPPSQLLHEARKLARVRHTNVVAVHGADRHNGRVGFWMDYIDGETLASRVNKGRLSAGEAVSVGQEVCRALAAVHQANLIHRDVKAQNVMRASDGGRIILMDFGAGEFVGDPAGKRAQGTPLYLAPEVLRGGDATVRSDIYAVGVLLYHLVTARFPVDAPSPAALNAAHERGERKRLRDERADLPDSFIAIVERAIDPDPQRRYGSAGDMEAKLSGEPSTRPITVTPGPQGSPIGDYAKRAAIVATAAVGMTVVLGFIAARGFEVFLRINPEFSLDLPGIFRVGVRAVFPFAMGWIVFAAVVGLLAGLRQLAPGRIREAIERPGALLARLNPAGVATGVFVLGTALWLGLIWYYRDVFSALFALRENPQLPTSALSILDPENDLHEIHGSFSALLSFFLALAVWRWFPILERRSEDASALRPMKWATLAIAFLTVAQAVLPRRATWERYEIASFDNRPALVIGSTGAEVLLLYDSDGVERHPERVTRSDARLRLTGQTRALFGSAQRAR
jgi:hypothetical protein